MPIYEYECCGCGHQFELLVLSTTTARCPECEGEELKRMLSRFVASSDSTREANLAAGRRRASAVKHDKIYEEDKAHRREIADD